MVMIEIPHVLPKMTSERAVKHKTLLSNVLITHVPANGVLKEKSWTCSDPVNTLTGVHKSQFGHNVEKVFFMCTVQSAHF